MSVPDSSDRNAKFEWQDAFLNSGVRGAAFKVGQAIANVWNGGDRLPYATGPWLAKNTGYSERQVRRALDTLQEKGWIARARKGGKRGNEVWPSVWRLTYPNMTSASSQHDMDVIQVDPSIDPHWKTHSLVGQETRSSTERESATDCERTLPNVDRHKDTSVQCDAREDGFLLASPWAYGENAKPARDRCPTTALPCSHRCGENTACITNLVNDGHTEYAEWLLSSGNSENGVVQ